MKKNRLIRDGYIFILMLNHKRADRDGYVREHILIAEKALGKSLPPKAVVHHVNGTRHSGRLVICENQAYHHLLHQRKRAYDACGNPSWLKCNYCKQYDDPINLYVHKPVSYHRKCKQINKAKNRSKALPVWAGI